MSDTTSTSWLDRAVLLATVLTCWVALSPNCVDPDLWGHVQYGRDWLAHGFHSTATYSFTAEGYRWINHENIAELLSAIGMDSLGVVGMLVAKSLLGLMLVGLIMWHAWRQGASLITICLTGLLVSVNLTFAWAMRPQLLTWVCYTLLLLLLTWCFAGWEGTCWWRWLERREAGAPTEPSYSRVRMRFLWLVVPLLCFWANSHGGFVAGYCILVAYLGLRGLEAFACRGRECAGLLRRFALMLAAAGLATLITPYGPQLHGWLLESLSAPRPEITEWRRPEMFTTLMLPLWLMMFSCFAVLLLTQRSRDVTHLVILGLTLWQSLAHVRHAPFFAIACGLWLPVHVESVLRRFNIVRPAASFTSGLSFGMRWAFGGVLTVAFVLTGVRLGQRLSDLPVPRSQYPVAAFQYIADQGLQGKLIVTFNWAQYALAAFGQLHPGDDGLRISFDGRYDTCYPQHVVDMNFDFILGNFEPRYRGSTSPPFDDNRVLEFNEPDLVLISRLQPHAVNVMFRQRDRWTLLYQDKLAQLWGRTSKYGDPDSPHFVATEHRRITEDEQEGTVRWPALPVRQRHAQELAARM